jgi:hypothetical protein
MRTVLNNVTYSCNDDRYGKPKYSKQTYRSVALFTVGPHGIEPGLQQLENDNKPPKPQHDQPNAFNNSAMWYSKLACK